MKPRKGLLKRSGSRPLRDASLFIVATEGEKTEKQYIEGLFQNNSRFHVHVIQTEMGKSAPEFVLGRLDELNEEYKDFVEGDEFWLVIDFDRWGPAKLRSIAQQAQQKKYNLAISKPCFELWLFLHHEELDEKHILGKEKLNRRTVEQWLKTTLGGYKKSKLDVSKFEGKEASAISRAKAIDDKVPGERWPVHAGTHVYKLIEKLIERQQQQKKP